MLIFDFLPSVNSFTIFKPYKNILQLKSTLIMTIEVIAVLQETLTL